MLVNIADKAEQRHNRHIRVAFVQHLVRVVGDDDAGFQPQPGEIADVLTDDGRIYVDCADDLRAVLVQIAQNIFAHFSAAILNHPDFFHNTALLEILRR